MPDILWFFKVQFPCNALFLLNLVSLKPLSVLKLTFKDTDMWQATIVDLVQKELFLGFDLDANHFYLFLQLKNIFGVYMD